MPIFHRFTSPKILSLDYKTAATTNTQKYLVTYTSGIQDLTTRYSVKYTTNYPIESVIGITAKNTYQYDDQLLSFKVNYTSGVEILEKEDRYRVVYISDNPTAYKAAYRIIYNSQVIPTESSTSYRITYTSDYLNTTRNNYTIRYSSVGIESIEHRSRLSVRYTSQSLGDFSSTYKVKYTTSVFYDNSSRYFVRYTSEGAEEIVTSAAILKSDKGRLDALIEIRSSEDKGPDSYLYVLSNMPKYQLVEFQVEDQLSYMGFIPEYEVTDIFPPNNWERYKVKGYILIKDIDPKNSLSLDLYENETMKKINKAKSYFFDLSSTSYIPITTSILDTSYVSKNITENKYEYGNLNFVYTEVTPIFSPGDSCCFSRKILPPGSPNTSGACSPF